MKDNKVIIIVIGILVVLIISLVIVLVSIVNKDKAKNQNVNINDNIQPSNDIIDNSSSEVSSNNDEETTSNQPDENADETTQTSLTVNCQYVNIKGMGMDINIDGVGKSRMFKTKEIIFDESGKGKDFMTYLYTDKFKIVSREQSTKDGYKYSINDNILKIEYKGNTFYVGCIKKSNIEDFELNIKINDSKNIFSGNYEFDDDSFNSYTYKNGNKQLTLIDAEDKDYYIIGLSNNSVISDEFYCDELALWEYSNTEKDYDYKFGTLSNEMDTSRVKFGNYSGWQTN